ANASAGFLVYGVNSGGGLDPGALDTVGTESIKAWVEKVIPAVTIPPVHICQARVVRVPGHHAPDRCAVVVSIPLSEHRPHWSNQNGREVAYIRAGEHSLPMKLQTLLDISSHGIAPLGAIVDIGVLGYEMRGGQFHFTLNPLIRLENGPMCER